MFESKKKLFIIILLTSTLWQQNAHGYITIRIEREGLQQMGDVLVQTYVLRVLQSSTTRGVHMTSVVRTILRGVYQMFGIMVTFVGANLMTSKLKPFLVQRSEFSATNITAHTSV